MGFVASAVLVPAALTACGGSGPVRPVGLGKTPAAFHDLFHPHRFAPKEVKAAFAKQGIRLREMRTRYGPHVVVLFDPRWHTPTDFQVDGRDLMGRLVGRAMERGNAAFNRWVIETVAAPPEAS
jgi:hypothetical protein